MRRRLSPMRRNNNNLGGRRNFMYTPGKLSSLILIVVGVLLSLPFTLLVVFGGQSYHYIGIPQVLMMLGGLTGWSSFIMGIIGLFAGGSSSSQIENDVSRIRFAAEREMFSKKE